MKNNFNLQFTVSAQNGSNRVISSSEEKFNGFREGSLIKIKDDSNLYTVLNKENSFLIKDFKVLENRTIFINEDIGVNLQRGDILKITYKEYELLMVLSILNNGKDYNIGDDLFINDGDAIIDILTGNKHLTILTVLEVNEKGGIKKLGVKSKGKYLIPPKNKTNLINENGICEAIVETKYIEIDNATIIERVVSNINIKDNKSYIMLDYSLTPNLKEGKFSVEKCLLTLSCNYSGETGTNLEYKIYYNFTPNLNIPLMVQNSQSSWIIFNKAMQILDSRLREIEEKIK